MPDQNRPNASWTSREAYLLALVCLTAGLLLGYLLRGPSSSRGGAPAAESAGAPAGGSTAGGAAMPSAQALEPLAAPLLAAVKVDPANADAVIQLGNLYYDHKLYSQAIDYYNRALAIRPNDVNVRTDMGTAYWYTGSPERAVAEYEKSLAIDPTHANTLFNLGVVRSQGLKDYKGAVATWEKLLKTNPQYPNREKVLELMEQAKSQQK